jgi:hypothetical protein
MNNKDSSSDPPLALPSERLGSLIAQLRDEARVQQAYGGYVLGKLLAEAADALEASHVAKTHNPLTGRCTRCDYAEADGHATTCIHYEYWRSKHQLEAAHRAQETLHQERDVRLMALTDAVQVARHYSMLFHDETWQARLTKWEAALSQAPPAQETRQQTITDEKLQRLYSLVANLAHPNDDHLENELEDEAHDIIREMRMALAALRCRRDTRPPDDHP